ncbi:MAG: UpxY family transcription antiterminator [Bacteroidales bacterium]|nr:UpxY family transcription antiterminator [Bacteroidales bacterium]
MAKTNSILSKSYLSTVASPKVGALRPTPCAGEAKWFAIYTKPRAEKMVTQRLSDQGFEAYLPLVKTLRQWSDRKKFVEVPLINSYIFVKVKEHLLSEVLQIDGASRYISFEGKPASIPQQQIDNLRILIDGKAKIDITGENLKAGDPVEVTHGALQGLRGELVKIGNRNKVVVRIDKLDLNLAITIQKAFLRKLR